MSRRHAAEKREINPDPKFGDLVVTKFMNAVMYDGKKSVAETIVYGALDQVQSKTKQEPVAVFHQALDNVAPHVEVRSRRVGGATYQVPVDVRPERRQALAIRWLITAARNRNETTMVDRLSGELLDAGQRAVDDGLGDRLLAVVHQVVHELGDDLVPELGVRQDLTPLGLATSRHLSIPHFGRFAPYFERRCLRFLTPWVSSTPRRIW